MNPANYLFHGNRRRPNGIGLLILRSTQLFLASCGGFACGAGIGLLLTGAFWTNNPTVSDEPLLTVFIWTTIGLGLLFTLVFYQALKEA